MKSKNRRPNSGGSNKKQQVAPAKTREPTLAEALESLGISADSADYVVFSDGSGSNFNASCGFGSVSVELATGERSVNWGCLSKGTSNVAELLAVVQALDWISKVAEDRKSNKKGSYKAVLQVHIVTDSEYCRTTGSTGKSRLCAKNVGLWGMYEQYARRGIMAHWHHIPRNSIALHEYVDRVSKLARLRAKNYNLLKDLGKGEEKTPYQVNRSEE